ncbi:hypothetical protein KKH38_04595, partial [Patescibacteria group bacterium]|nr:hypothetical protein [Patescibacteria group bacterium]MBU4601186.1 hypothetical protein [Patescibacteria group bacterium]MCG2698642.1 hypothetical protein [Candidatus Parcubacteria bacterium]
FGHLASGIRNERVTGIGPVPQPCPAPNKDYAYKIERNTRIELALLACPAPKKNCLFNYERMMGIEPTL